MIDTSACLICRHYLDRDKRNCKAFPNRIPDEIYYSDREGGDHHQKHPSQKGDFTFEVNDEFKKYYDMFYDKDGNRKPITNSKIIVFEQAWVYDRHGNRRPYEPPPPSVK